MKGVEVVQGVVVDGSLCIDADGVYRPTSRCVTFSHLTASDLLRERDRSRARGPEEYKNFKSAIYASYFGTGVWMPD